MILILKKFFLFFTNKQYMQFIVENQECVSQSSGIACIRTSVGIRTSENKLHHTESLLFHRAVTTT